ncbi:hypothetical protein GE09DRAFT_1210966 [Coniochaeta sp. 2T2.1]|nr:hypothetical protein GE09DRAFT_1210966 [Coniochaeta sp. 2T2.1]
MAVIDAVPGIKVVVVVDGQVAEEWDPPNNFDGVEIIEWPPQTLDDDNDKPHGYCVKYIEAVPGAHFKFVVDKERKFKRYRHHMAYNVQIDGSFTELDHEHDQEGRNQGIQEKLFRFNDLRIVEDNVLISVEELAEERERFKDCGALRLGKTPPITVVNQKVLGGKTLSQSTTFTAQPCQYPSRVSIKPYFEKFLDRQFNEERNWDKKKARPFAIFEFRYRTRDELVKEGFVPPPEVVDQVEAMSEAERRRLLEKLLAEDIQRRRTATPFEEIQQWDIKPEPPSP